VRNAPGFIFVQTFISSPEESLQTDRTAYADLVSTLPLSLVARHPDGRQRERAVRAPFTPGFGVDGQISA
jgi:hypothetical protein